MKSVVPPVLLVLRWTEKSLHFNYFSLAMQVSLCGEGIPEVKDSFSCSVSNETFSFDLFLHPSVYPTTLMTREVKKQRVTGRPKGNEFSSLLFISGFS
jgi:hypothetical protein